MASTTPDTPVSYCFEDVRVDPRAHRVTRAGAEVALEPKAYAVLLELVRQPGAAIARDALLDTVWGHRHVTPAVLNRIIAVLRRGLGDDAEHPRLIRTVHGVGYAFIAPVRVEAVLAPATDAGAAIAAAPPVAPADGAVAATETPTAEPAMPPALRARGLLLLAMGFAVLAAVLFTDIAREPAGERGADAGSAAEAGSLVATGTSAEPDRNGSAAVPPADATLAVMPLKLGGEIADGAALAEALVDTWSESLARLPSLQLIGVDSARAAATLDLDLPGLARTLGASHVLRGVLAPGQGDQLVLDVELLRLPEGDPLWLRQFHLAPTFLFRTVPPLLVGVSEALLPEAARSAAPARSESAADLAYWRGMVSLRKVDAPPEDALAHFEAAVAADPDYAPAYVRISTTYRYMALGGRISLDDAMARGRVATARALALQPDLVEAWLEEVMQLSNQWRSVEADTPMRRAVALAPHHPGVLNASANLAAYVGRPNEALEAAELARRVDPLNPQRSLAQAWSLSLLGRHDEAMAVLRHARDALSGGVIVRNREIRTQLMAGRVSDAVAMAIAVEARIEDEGVYRTADAIQALVAGGRLDAARRRFDGYVPARPTTPGYADSVLLLHWAEGREREAAAWIEGEGGDTVQRPWREAFAGRARAALGDYAGALAAWNRAFADPVDRQLVAYSWFPLRIGAIDLANWLALRRIAADGATDAAWQADAEALYAMLETMRAGGVALGAFHYLDAAGRLLADDVAGARERLARAVEAGWVDPLGLRVDPVWRLAGDAAWLREIEAARDARVRR